jgi:hypothetical protein
VQGKQNQRVRLAGYFGFRPTHKPGRACGPTLLMVPAALIISAVAVMLGRSTFAHHAKLVASRGKPHIGKRRKPCYMGQRLT